MAPYQFERFAHISSWRPATFHRCRDVIGLCALIEINGGNAASRMRNENVLENPSTE